MTAFIEMIVIIYQGSGLCSQNPRQPTANRDRHQCQAFNGKRFLPFLYIVCKGHLLNKAC